MVWAKVAFGVALVVSLLAGFMTIYARDVRRDRKAARVFMFVGVTSVVASGVVGWWWL